MKQKRMPAGRSPGNTQISISMPQSMLDSLDKLAASQRRTRSNMLHILVDDAVSKMQNAAPPPPEAPEHHARPKPGSGEKPNKAS